MNVSRPVRICSVVKDPKICKVIGEALGRVEIEKFTYERRVSVADLIIFTEPREIIDQGFDRKKTFAFLMKSNMVMFSLPDNCVVVDPLNIAGSLDDIIN